LAARLAPFLTAAILAGCTWTEYQGMKHRTFLAETQINLPISEATNANSAAAAQSAGSTARQVSLSTTSAAATGAIERAARELPESFRRDSVSRIIDQK